MTQLEVLPDQSWSRVLCIVAHPDDMEYGASAAVAAWTARGIEVGYVLVTSGEAGMDLPPSEVGALRVAEQRKACAEVGVEHLEVLGYPDGMLEYTLDLRRDIARTIREFRPDAVVTANFDLEAYGGYNQADHRVTGLAVVDGVAAADNTWVFPELAKDGLAKWGTQWLLVAGHPESTHAVPVTQEHVAAGVASLRSHEAYLAYLPNHPKPEEFIPEVLRYGGEAAGHEFAVTFRATRLGGLAGD